MSIRTLTDRLHEEFLEVGRNRQFDAMRSRTVNPHSENTVPPSSATQPSLRTAEPSRTPGSVPSETSPGLRTRHQENPWGIPGGIANRFGREALAQMRAQEAQTEQQQMPEETERAVESQTQADASSDPAEIDRPTEDASERNEAARITIELQSH